MFELYRADAMAMAIAPGDVCAVGASFDSVNGKQQALQAADMIGLWIGGAEGKVHRLLLSRLPLLLLLLLPPPPPPSSPSSLRTSCSRAQVKCGTAGLTSRRTFPTTLRVYVT
jgi:hypothetical protein